MHMVRRILYIPIFAILIASLLIAFNVIEYNLNFPISVEVIAMIAGVLLVVFFIADMRIATSSSAHPEPEEAPRSTKVIYPKVMEETVESFKEAEEFVVKANGRVDIRIDIEEDPEEES